MIKETDTVAPVVSALQQVLYDLAAGREAFVQMGLEAEDGSAAAMHAGAALALDIAVERVQARIVLARSEACGFRPSVGLN